LCIGGSFSLLGLQVFYYLEQLGESLTFALGAGQKFDVSSKSEYVETLISKGIDQYIALRVQLLESKPALSDEAKATLIDPRLEVLVERMFQRCFADGEYKQALGIALETRRLDHLRTAITVSGMLQVCHIKCFILCCFIAARVRLSLQVT